MSTLSVRIVTVHQATASNWSSSNPILPADEIGLEVDTGKIKWGNGSSRWNSLSYASGVLQFDSTPTASSPNPVTSNGIKSALNAKINTSGGTFTGLLVIDAQNLKITGSVSGYNDCLKNSIWRGKSLGNALTAAQSAAIQNGSFDDLYIGDHWTIPVTVNGSTVNVVFRIAAFDYYYQVGDGYNASTNPTGSITNTHHIVVVPDRPLYNHAMNDSNTTEGGYVGSKMYTEGLDSAKAIIQEAFGNAHLLSVRQYLSTSVDASKGYVKTAAWSDETCWLMTEQNVYGGRQFGSFQNGENYSQIHTLDNRQYPLFRFAPVHRQTGSRFTYWLRDPASATNFANVGYGGHSYAYSASTALGVRPAFCVI